MRAVRIARPGGWGRLELIELEEPSCGPSEVKVDVAAIGVNFADVVVRMGLYASAKKYVGWPITPGFEIAGTVREVGADVRGVRPGDRVLGVTRFGGYASVVVVPESQVRSLPTGLSMSEGATFPVVFLTAWYALRELCKLRLGSRVLVHSAAGGVGGAALQIARTCGAKSVAVVGAPHKVELARALGAAEVIDKSTQPLWPTVERLVPDGFDIALDPNGASTLLGSYRHLAPAGRLVVYGFHSMLRRGRGTPDYLKLAFDYWRTPRFDPVRMTNANKSVMAFNLSYLFERMELFADSMDELLAWVADGRVKPLPVREFALGDVAEAQRALESGTTTGKIALIP